MSEKIIRIKSGNEEFTMSVTEESYEAWKNSASEEAGMARAGNWLPALSTVYEHIAETPNYILNELFFHIYTI